MKTVQLLVIAGGIAIAATLYNKREPEATDQWNEGFTAGWVTPGPGTVILLTGIVAYNV